MVLNQWRNPFYRFSGGSVGNFGFTDFTSNGMPLDVASVGFMLECFAMAYEDSKLGSVEYSFVNLFICSNISDFVPLFHFNFEFQWFVHSLHSLNLTIYYLILLLKLQCHLQYLALVWLIVFCYPFLSFLQPLPCHECESTILIRRAVSITILKVKPEINIV